MVYIISNHYTAKYSTLYTGLGYMASHTYFSALIESWWVVHMQPVNNSSYAPADLRTEGSPNGLGLQL